MTEQRDDEIHHSDTDLRLYSSQSGHIFEKLNSLSFPGYFQTFS